MTVIRSSAFGWLWAVSSNSSESLTPFGIIALFVKSGSVVKSPSFPSVSLETTARTDVPGARTVGPSFVARSIMYRPVSPSLSSPIGSNFSSPVTPLIGKSRRAASERALRIGTERKSYILSDTNQHNANATTIMMTELTSRLRSSSRCSRNDIWPPASGSCSASNSSIYL